MQTPNALRVYAAGRECLAFFISPEDRDLANYRWYIVTSRGGRAAVVRYEVGEDGTTSAKRLGCEVFERVSPGFPRGSRTVFHINGDVSDYRRENLWAAPRRAPADSLSADSNIFRKVRKGGERWVASASRTTEDGRERLSKTFATREEAVAWRDEMRAAADPLRGAIAQPAPVVWVETLPAAPPPRGKAWPRADPHPQ